MKFDTIDLRDQSTWPLGWVLVSGLGLTGIPYARLEPPRRYTDIVYLRACEGSLDYIKPLLWSDDLGTLQDGDMWCYLEIVER